MARAKSKSQTTLTPTQAASTRLPHLGACLRVSRVNKSSRVDLHVLHAHELCPEALSKLQAIA
jgi:hypothetical protein